MHDEHPEMTWTFDSGTSGPTAAVVGGVHGNELAGIGIVKALAAGFGAGGLAVRRGRLLLAIGNPRAVAAGRRFTEADLNRCFTRAVLDGAGGPYEHGRARELSRFLRDASFCIDVHGTNAPTEPFIVIQREARPSDDAALRHLSADIVLRDPAMVFSGTPATLDEYVARDGGLGICYETGSAGDRTVVDRVAKGVLDALAGGGWLDGPATPPRDRARKEFILREAIVVAGEFRYSNGAEERNFRPLRKGEMIGECGGEPRFAPEDCLLVFPKPPSLQSPGQPVGYLAVPA